MSPDPDDAAPSRRDRPHDDGPPDGARDGTRPDAAVAELERHRTELRELGLETSPAPRDALVDPTRPLVSRRGWQDNTFRVATHSGGTLVLLIMTMVGLFLLYRGAQAIDVAGWDFVTEQAWEPNSGRFGIAAVLFGTVVIGLTAIGVAVPLALMTATYITEYAPAGIKRLLIGVTDLMAAIPSVVYGLWGAYWLEGNLLPVAEWIATYFGWIPIFSAPYDPDDPFATATVFTASAVLAGLIVAMMVAPISAAIMREVFDQAPVGEREGALALGASKWGVIRNVVYPFGRGGIIGGTMLGLGRALGETIAVYLVISPIFVINPQVLSTGTNSISALIALRHGEANAFEVSALMAAGLVLFLMTMLINFAAGFVIQRSRSGAAS